ncbi:MAG: hypothetical protein O3C40_36185 [Planctomycetota bacterium]|nr:hypothetical protein [Planctomycetota bacterium]
MLRPLLRFRLRTLFITMSVLAAVAAFVARPMQAYRQEADALSHIPGSRQVTQPQRQFIAYSAVPDTNVWSLPITANWTTAAPRRLPIPSYR